MDNRRIKIVVCGGGNGSHTTVATTGSKPEFEVCVFTRRPQDWKPQIKGLTKNSSWEHKGDFIGKISKCSNNPKDFGSGVKLWIIGGPAHIHQTILEQIAPYVEKDSFVGTLFAQGGFDWMCRYVFGERLKKENITYFGLFNIPWLCKIANYGESVRIIGPKTSIHVASSNASTDIELLALLNRMFDIPTFKAPNFMNLTLTPSNQIIHPARVYAVFKDWDGKKVFQESEIPTFYEDFDDLSAEVLQQLDDEIQAIKKAINTRYTNYDLNMVVPIKQRIINQYGEQVKDQTNLKTVFRTNQGYATVRIPTKAVQGGVHLNTEARIFWEDVPYGLCILKDLARMLDVKTPGIDSMIEWHQKFMNKTYLKDGQLVPSIIRETGAPSKYGLDTIEKVLGESLQTDKPLKPAL